MEDIDMKALKVGDRVLVGERHGFQERRHKPGTVTRRTPSGLTTVMIDAYPPHGTISHELVFNANGRERGERGYAAHSIAPFSEQVLAEELAQATVKSHRSDFEDWRMWRKMPDALILKVAELLAQHQD